MTSAQATIVPPPTPARLRRRSLAGPLALGLALGGLALSPAAAQAAPAEIIGASFEWGLNEQHQQGAQFGGCDYFSAGLGDGSADSYRTQQGNVQIIKRSAAGEAQSVTASNRCALDADGKNRQRMLLTQGVGERHPGTGITRIGWTGSVTVNSYGGLVPWHLSDPVLTVLPDGSGTLTATLGGFGSTQENPGAKEPLTPTPGVTVATLTDVEITDAGIVTTPDYAGRDYFPLTETGRSPVSVITEQMKQLRPGWGSWPESFLDFQYRTGLNSYWHTSGLSADDKKPAAPIEIEFAPAESELAPEIIGHPAAVTVSAGSDVVFTSAVSGTPAPGLRWQRLAPGGDWADIAGETADTLRLTGVAVSDTGHRFRVVAENAAGTATSNPATLTVQAVAPIVITEQPKSVTVLAGRVLRLSVTVTGSAPSYQWQRSTDAGASWQDWGGTAAESGIVPTDKLSFSGNQYRVLVSNGVDAPVVSDVATVTLEGAPVRVTESQVDAIGYDGGKVIFRAYGTGSPAPDWEWQVSADRGKTWQTYALDKTTILYVEPLTLDMDGLQFRALLDNGISEPQATVPSTLTVLPSTQKSIAYSPAAVFDPEAGGTVSLSGTGFRVPEQQPPFLRVGVMTRADWDAEGAPNREDFIETAFSVYGSTLIRDAGSFARTLTLAPGQLSSGTEYVLAGISSKADDRSLDVAVPFVLTGEDRSSAPAPVLITNDQLDSVPQRPMTGSSVVAGEPLTLTGLDADAWVHLTLYSDPVPLGWVRADTAGDVTVPVPETVPTGEHRLVVQSPAGDLRGWQDLAVSAPVPDGTDGADGADGADGTDAGDGADGRDGGDGADGADGTDATDGADGTDSADGTTDADGSGDGSGPAIDDRPSTGDPDGTGEARATPTPAKSARLSDTGASAGSLWALSAAALVLLGAGGLLARHRMS